MVTIRLSDALRLLQLALEHPEPPLPRVVTRALAAAGIAVHEIIESAIAAAQPTVWAVDRLAESWRVALAALLGFAGTALLVLA